MRTATQVDHVDTEPGSTIAVLADELPAVLGAIRRTIRRAVGAGSLFGPLGGAQAELLRLVRHRPGVSVTAAAGELQVAANTVSTLVSQLREAGLLDRLADPADRRLVRLQLTGRAQAEICRWRDQQAHAVAEALHRLPGNQVRALAEAMPALAALAEALAPRQGYAP